jgi:hypothetical protein
VFLYYQFNINKTLEKSNKGNLPNTTEKSGAKFGMFIEEIPFKIKNYGTTEVIYGTFYSIEAFKEDGWYTVPFKKNRTFTTEAIGLRPGGVDNSIINLDIFSYKFPKGKYRIIKYFFVDESKVPLAVEFVLD